MLRQIILTLAVLSGISLTSRAATISWGAGQTNGLSLEGGTNLPIDSLVRLGTFTALTDSQIQAYFLASNFAALESSWVQAGTERVDIGAGPGAPGHFAASTNFDTTSIVGQQIYMWALASTDNMSVSSSISTATQMGIFYMDKAVNFSWAFPGQTPVAGSTTIDLAELTDIPTGTILISGAHVVVGSFSDGTSTSTGYPNFGLKSIPSVPEPSRGILLGLGTVGLLLRRRR